MLTARTDGRLDAMCSRCLVPTIVDDEAALRALDWQIWPNGQTWCLQCSKDARTPKGRPNQRGVIRRRR